MEIRILGPIEAWVGDEAISLGGRRQRTLLALLALNSNQVVSADRLIEDLWSGDPPDTARKSLQVYISRLRRLLDREEDSALVTRAPGYVLALQPDQLDALQFRRLLEEGQNLIADSPALAAKGLREGLALWRGPALQDLAAEPALAPDLQRLEDERLRALELRIDADLAVGRHAELVGELESLCHLYPYREHFTSQLMLALYRAGRQTEALRSYQVTREWLVEELGLEPSPDLQELEEKILKQEPSLREAVQTTKHAESFPPIMRGYELREDLGTDDWGVRYRGFHTASGTEVMVKVIDPRLAHDPGFVRRFDFEATHLAALEHPAVARVVDFWRDQEGAYLVTKWYGKASLVDRLVGDSLTREEAASLLEQVAGALDAARSHGLVHGNLSPTTVVIGPDGGAVLIDFGITHDLVSGGPPPSPHSDLEAFERLIIASGWAASQVREPHTYESAISLVREVLSIDAEKEEHLPAPVGNPYKGLRAFAEADADNFFGRERLVDQLVGRLSRAGTEGRLVGVVGPSGSGKSSLVQAGLIPAIHDGRVAGSAHWFVGRLVPGERPFEELESLLLRLAINPPSSLLDQLQEGERSLHRALLRCLPDDASELLLVIDQFEELFTSAPETATSFLDMLATALGEPRSRLRLVLTLRADFYDRPLLHRAFGDLLRDGVFTLSVMSAEELERAISAPAERRGVSVERSLVVEMVADVADQPAALPLLQYALTELFERRTGPFLTLDSYRDIGGMQGALVTRAESVYREFDEEARSAARQILLRLLVLEEGAGVARRRVQRRELVSMQMAPGLVDRVLEAFGAARLLSFDRDRMTRASTVEVAHEALLYRWDRLADWIDEAADDLAMQRRLSTLLREWLISGQDSGVLLAPGPLDQFTTWQQERAMTLTADERDFLDASRIHQLNEERMALERVGRERDLEHRAGSRLRMLVAVMAVASVVGLTLMAVAVQRGADASRSGARAEAVGLSAAAIANTEVDGQLALNLALMAWEAAADADIPIPAETEAAVHLALQAERVTYPVADAPTSIVLGPGGPKGIYRLPPDQLFALATENLERSLTEEECLTYQGQTSCSAPNLQWVPASTDPSLWDAQQTDRSLAGAQVSLSQPGTEDLEPTLLDPMAPLETATGITIVADARVDLWEGHQPPEKRPDIVLIPPGLIGSLVEQGELVELSRYLDMETVRRQFAPELLKLGSVGDDNSWPSADGRLFGAPITVSVKSLIWYRPELFGQHGYEVPTTWDELMSLSHRITSDGGTPWCMGEWSDGADGWPATDWIEDILIHSAGPAVYDHWVRHEIPFNHSDVIRAGELLGDIYFEPGFVDGGPEEAARRPFDVASTPMFEDPPGCWLHHFPTFASNFFPSGVVVGEDVKAFPFPDITPAHADATVGAADIIVTFRDRPEVREVVRYMLSPAWGHSLREDFRRGYPAHLAFAPERIRDQHHRTLLQDLQTSMRSDGFRLDGSDLMPPDVGAGSFWAGMIDYITSGPEHLDRVLADIEASWPDH